MTEKKEKNQSPSRAEKSAKRRSAIVEAAKKEFLAKGFESARIDEIAKAAGVAKGTVYLHFADKKALFEEAVRSVMMPLATKAANDLTSHAGSARATLEPVLLSMLQGMMSPQIGPMLRLLIAEAIRFPQLGDFYRAEVVMPMIDRLRSLLRQAAASGELRCPDVAEYPQLLISPVLLTVIWQGAFNQLVTFDLDAMIKTHLDALFIE